jgi:hypothetical protein
LATPLPAHVCGSQAFQYGDVLADALQMPPAVKCYIDIHAKMIAASAA